MANTPTPSANQTGTCGTTIGKLGKRKYSGAVVRRCKRPHRATSANKPSANIG